MLMLTLRVTADFLYFPHYQPAVISVMTLFMLCCRPSPSSVVEFALHAVDERDHVAFERQFTQDSAAILSGLRVLATNGRDAFLFPQTSDSWSVVRERIVVQGATLTTTDPPERVDMAVVDVHMGGKTLPIPLLLERGRWKISLTALEQLWYRGPDAPFAASEFAQ